MLIEETENFVVVKFLCWIFVKKNRYSLLSFESVTLLDKDIETSDQVYSMQARDRNSMTTTKVTIQSTRMQFAKSSRCHR